MHGESDGSSAAGALDVERLEWMVARDPGAPVFALLVEAYRRVGRLDDARRVAVAGLAVRPNDGAGRLALGITLLDLDENAAAHYELERAMSSIGGAGLAALPRRDDGATFRADTRPTDPLGAPADAVGDDELERAFADAESVREEMVDANQIAQAALRADSLDTPEGFALDSSGTFATETMARLLEEQGDGEGAAAIRNRLAPARMPMDAAEVPEASRDEASEADSSDETNAMLGAAALDMSAAARDRARILATLETWLDNLRRIPA